MPEQQVTPNQNLETPNEAPVIPVEGEVVTPPADDLSTLFTPDEIKAKKESAASAKAEEERRSKLTPEELKAEDDKKAEEAENDKVPETYADFKVPEGMTVDKDMLNEAVPLFKELGFTQAEAQKVVDLYSSKILPGIVKRQTEAWDAQKAAWKTELTANKEIKLDDKGANIDGQKVINTLFSNEEAATFKAELVKFGLDNHPQLNLLLSRMAKHLKEDTIEDNKGGGFTPSRTLEDVADRLYK